MRTYRLFALMLLFGLCACARTGDAQWQDVHYGSVQTVSSIGTIGPSGPIGP